MILRRFAVFAIIFAPVLNVGLGQFGDSLSLLCALLVGWFVLRALLGREFTLHVEARYLLLIVALTIVYALATGSLLGAGNAQQLVLRPVRTLLMFAGVYVFVQIYAKHAGPRLDRMLVDDVFVAIAAHGAIMVAEFLHPPLRDAIYPYTFADQVIEWNQGFRMAGIQTAGGAQLSVYQSVGLILYPFVLAQTPSFGRRFAVHAGAVIIALSLLLSGRSGIICAALFMPFAIYWAASSRGVSALASFGAKAGIFVLILGIGLTALRAGDFLEAEQASKFEVAARRGIDFLFSAEGGQSRADLAAELGQYFFVPEDPLTLLVGNPPLFEAAYLMQDRIVNTDIGYVIFLFGYGLIGSLLQYSFYGLILYYSIRYRRHSPQLASISLLMVLVIMLFQAKEVFVFTRIGLSLTSLFALALFCAKRRSMPRLVA